MNVLVDSNIVLDVLLERTDFLENSKKIIALSGRDTYTAAVTASMITDIYYILQKHTSDHEKTRESLLSMIESLRIIDVTEENCLHAFSLPIIDYEDALLVECARQWGAEYIVTRNTRDFSGSPVAVLTPDEFLTRTP